jgi:apolipoprotein D and lipocalin family protein
MPAPSVASCAVPLFVTSVDGAFADEQDMKLLGACYWSLAALVVLLMVSCRTTTRTRPLPTASSVELNRYAGRWHEITRLPNAFQRDDSKAMADYSLLPDGSVKVVNTELRPNGSQKKVEGRATVVPGSDNTRLRVKFSGLAALAPASKEGNYWIIKLADDYSVVLVGTPDRKFLWLLARDANLPEAVKKAYVEEARRLGFATDKLL